MTAARIRFYFDYESPNAYLAWTQLPRLEEQYGAMLDLLPVLYAALLDAHGQLGPGEVPAKGRWMSKNLLRKATLLGVPLNPPAFLPFNPLLALRISMLPLEDAKRRALIDALFRAAWVRGLHLSDAAVVVNVANEVGLAGAALVEQAQTPEIKDRLRQQTNEAVARGVFGVPSMEVGDELFWGYDDFPFLELLLAGKDPVVPGEWEKWSRPLRASSVRRRFRSTNDDGAEPAIGANRPTRARRGRTVRAAARSTVGRQAAEKSNSPTSTSEAKVPVFFYGSYMSRDVLAEVAIFPDAIEMAVLRGYDIEVRPLANLIRDEARCVYGVLTAATHAELERLYAHARTVLGGSYLPFPVVVEPQHRDAVPALCYISSSLHPGPAANDYIDRIIEPAKQHGFPVWYIARLESFRP